MASSSANRADRKAAGERARAAREEQARRERRTRLTVVGVAVGLVAVVAVTVAVIMGQASRSLLDGVDGPAAADDSGGIVVGQGGVGSPTDGAPTVAVYADFMCPFCAQFESANGPVLEELRQAGEATVVYHPVAFLDRFSEGTEYSTRSAQAVAVVAQDSPEHFVALWDELFANQPAENTPGLSDEEIAQLALGVGVPPEVVDTFPDGRYREWVKAASDQATRDLPVPATPTILVDGDVWSGDWRDPENLRSAVLGIG